MSVTAEQVDFWTQLPTGNTRWIHFPDSNVIFTFWQDWSDATDLQNPSTKVSVDFIWFVINEETSFNIACLKFYCSYFCCFFTQDNKDFVVHVSALLQCLHGKQLWSETCNCQNSCLVCKKGHVEYMFVYPCYLYSLAYMFGFKFVSYITYADLIPPFYAHCECIQTV